MSSSCCHLHGTLDALLTFDIGKVEFIVILLLVEFTAGVDDGGFVRGSAVHKLDDIHQCLHPKNLKLVDNSRFADVLLWYDESLELLFSGPDGDR